MELPPKVRSVELKMVGDIDRFDTSEVMARKVEIKSPQGWRTRRFQSHGR